MAKDKKKDAVERFMDRRKLAKAKSENLKVIPKKQKAKKIKRTGKCSPGKVLRGNKCVPRIEGKKPGKGEQTYKRLGKSLLKVGGKVSEVTPLGQLIKATSGLSKKKKKK